MDRPKKIEMAIATCHFDSSHIKSMLAISSRGFYNDEYILLNPRVVTNDSWEAWIFSIGSGLVTRFHSFAELMMQKYERLK